ncbi:phosphatidylinositol-4-phosphate 5-kinase, putative [Entamoeba nuttalli P19]|uniref:Phosphatidylinositol-4-phosphate 5-kinase, putative n=1 Tax=Entamoeba nuttalli (strain P19) TaxID=1076696 RepID=K2GUE5_ENTNP|nr:phosphatidylinositol-4-phosphate 5-kinase, putative [Entamoeba nuttalli P19]EKE38648.1 phosphatidylinositol-4-phosphate 5-kinase, putative [Entamoeba nuttalli P19]|eukprot:XP_008859022.1 phosphatidylinositol-4-phosphate 5-kinase, putative [Entamoeba nuttalli P19]
MSVETKEISQTAMALVLGIQHQVKYYLSKVHVSDNDFEKYKGKTLPELKNEKYIFKTYPFTKFTKKGGKDICGQKDNEMTTPKEVGEYVAKEYSPMAFAIVRRFFGLTPESMIESICGEGNLTPPNLGSGKSGSLFMFTKDHKFVIKVIPKREEKILCKIFPLYFSYIQENPQTLIPRFYGMFRIKPQKDEEYRYVVMNNLFPNDNFPLQYKFDLKGSMYGRKANEKERSKKSPCFKDLDFVEQKAEIHIGPKLLQPFKEQVEKDSGLMAKMHLIDYSMLVGVHNLTEEELEVACKKLGIEVNKTKKEKVIENDKERKHDEKEEDKDQIINTNDNIIGEPAQKQEESGSNETEEKESKQEESKQEESKQTTEMESKEESKKSESSVALSSITSTQSVSKNEATETSSTKSIETTKSTKEELKQVVKRPRASTVFTEQRVDKNLTNKDSASLTKNRKKKSDKVADAQEFLQSLEIPKPADFIFTDYEGGLLARNSKGELTGELYYLGIIDILMDYTARKKLETVVKGVAAGGADQVSSVSPSHYSRRFIKFILSNTK